MIKVEFESWVCLFFFFDYAGSSLWRLYFSSFLFHMKGHVCGVWYRVIHSDSEDGDDCDDEEDGDDFSCVTFSEWLNLPKSHFLFFEMKTEDEPHACEDCITAFSCYWWIGKQNDFSGGFACWDPQLLARKWLWYLDWTELNSHSSTVHHLLYFRDQSQQS